MGVRITAVQQVIDVVWMIRVIWWEGVRVFVGTGQLAVVAEVVQVLVVLLYGSCGGKTGASVVVLPNGGGGAEGRKDRGGTRGRRKEQG